MRLVETREEMRAALPGSRALVVELLAVGAEELAVGGELRVVQKYGAGPRNIDTAACAAKGVKVLTIRRRANIACAELAFALMLTLAKKLHRLAGRISVERLAERRLRLQAVRPPSHAELELAAHLRACACSTSDHRHHRPGRDRPRDRRSGRRRSACASSIFQRTRLPEAEERELQATYVPLETAARRERLGGAATAGRTGDRGPSSTAREFAQMKPGACLVNVSRADVVDRTALIDALKSGRLGGFALDPLYEEPGRSDDELLGFDNVILSPHIAAQPRFNALDDLADMMERLSKELERA